MPIKAANKKLKPKELLDSSHSEVEALDHDVLGDHKIKGKDDGAIVWRILPEGRKKRKKFLRKKKKLFNEKKKNSLDGFFVLLRCRCVD